MIENGEAARELLAASETKSALLGAIDRDPVQSTGSTNRRPPRAPRRGFPIALAS